MALTEAQIQTVDQNRKDPRPSWFNAVSEVEEEISLDFEAYIILLEDSIKDDIITQLKNVKKDSTKRKDRDAILSIAMDVELENATKKYEELAADLETFNEFRSSIKIDDFEQTVEIGQMLNDLQYNIDEDLHSLDRSEHLFTFTYLLQLSFNNGKLSDNILKEIDSWIKVFNSYKGVNNGKTVKSSQSSFGSLGGSFGLP